MIESLGKRLNDLHEKCESAKNMTDIIPVVKADLKFMLDEIWELHQMVQKKNSAAVLFQEVKTKVDKILDEVTEIKKQANR